MKNFFATFCLFLLVTIAPIPAVSEDRPAWAPYPQLVGVWTGQAFFMFPHGHTEQFHRFEITEQDGPFIKVTHAWEIAGKKLKSHDGKEYKYDATEAMLGVIAQDGTIHLIEHGDHTYFRMRLLNNHTIDFIATEGGEHPLVAHGVLIRQ